MRTVLRLAGIFVALYLLGLAVLYANQRSFIYPAPERDWPEAPGFERIALKTSDGLTLGALHRPALGTRPTVVFFHGNGDSLSGSLVTTAPLAEAGYGLLLAEYRGYAGNPGEPNEEGLYADGRAARDWLAEQGVGPERTVLMGFSLGTGVAIQLAREQTPAALVLIAPYTSLPDVVANRFSGLLPAQWLVKDRFESAAKLGAVRAPVLIVHDRDDISIPVEHGMALKAAAPTAELRLFSGHGHQLGFADEALAAIRDWLEAR